jgi:acyl-coenzyme A thioesterase PaaI-like protein
MSDHLGYRPDPENPGWLSRPQTDENRFLDVYGDMRVRAESPTVSRIQLVPRAMHRNLFETIHGGFLLAVVDHALFIGPAVQGRTQAAGGSTIDLSTQFLAPVVPEVMIDVVLETLRETHRMIFMRGTIEQDGAVKLAFSGTIKKARAIS